MKTVIVTFEAFADNAREIGGKDAEVLTRWDAGAVAGAELLMVFLHPAPDGNAWVDDGGNFVASAYDVERVELAGAVVFIGVCYGIENAKMIEALVKAGTHIVIAGEGVNAGGANGVIAGADWLAKGLRVMMGAGMPFGLAWPVARAITRIRAGQDAMGYRVVYRAELTPTKQRWATWAAGALGVVAFILQVIFGWGANPTTFFSSLLPTATHTAGPILTFTPGGTRKPWNITPFPTMTPCAGFGCMPTPGAKLTYDLYMPMINKEYEPSMYFGDFVELYVNGVITMSRTISVSYTDTLTKVDHVAVVNPSGNVTFTVVIENPTMITSTGWISTTGTVVTGTNVLTWTVSDVAAYQYWVITTTWSVLSGTFTTGNIDEIARVVCCDTETDVITLNYEP